MRKIFILLLLTFTTLFASQMGVVQGLDPNGDGFLSLRVQPKSKEIGKLYNGDEVDIIDKNGKYYKVKDIKSDKIGWAHSNWIKSISNAQFLLADIDNDNKKERLQLYEVSVNDYEGYYQLKLFDDNGDLLWKSNNSMVPFYETGGSMMPAILNDIDLDGNIELVLSTIPHEIGDYGFEIYRWDGGNFIKINKTKNPIGLVWTDAPNGNTLKWTEIDYYEYIKREKNKRNKIWSVYSLRQMQDDELPIVEIAGIKYPEYDGFFQSKAKIRFTPMGAVIEEWIK